MIKQICATGNDILNKVTRFIEQVFIDFTTLWYWPVILIGLMLLATIVMAFLVGFSYENRILKSVNKINAYFLSKPFITEDNLVEFNLKMKKVPKVLRNNWQIYMLNREDTPTTYINVNTCIDKPLRTSSIEKNMSNFSIFTIFLGLISFVAGLQYAFNSGRTGAIDALFYGSLIPLVIVIVYTIAILIIRLAKNDIYSCLYDNFPLYERNLTKAVSTLPSYVDYEILFTKKEIKEGIPILQQYLEKRALIEQQELEKARENSVACEEYNFDELGIDGSLVLERAMKECETFIKTRRRLQEECDQIETEKENYRKNFEITTKDYQRKLQASRENLESLKAQQEASTNRIESNYIKKQQGDEIKKQQQLEKDNEEATAKFNEEQVSLQQEIERREQEIEEKKAFVQQAMILEFKHYANTLYKALSQKAAEIGNQKLASLAQENTDLKNFVNDLQGVSGNYIDPNQGMMSEQEVAGQDLYEMSQSEQASLEDGRQISDEMQQQEDAKEAELKQAQQEAIAAQEAAVNEQIANVAQDESAMFNNNASVVVEDTTANNTTDGDINTGDTIVTGDVSVGGDGGQQMENVEPEQVVTQQEEDLDAIQKQIEEENANLQKQKQEFENDLNDTLSKMDAQEKTSEVDVTPIVEEQPAEEPLPIGEKPAEESAPVEDESKPEKTVKETAVEEEPEEEEKSDEEESDKKPARTTRRVSSSRSGTRSTSRTSASRGSSSRGSRASSKRSSSASAKKATSEIDALNAEMQKLLDSTKK